MRILFLTDNFPPERNAPASRTYEHARRWAEAGEDVTVVTCVPNFPEGKIHAGYRNLPYQVEEMDGVRVVRVWSYVAANRGVFRRVADYASFLVTGPAGAMTQRRPDVLVATSPQFFTALAGWVAATARRVPFVLEVRDLWPESIRAVGAIRDARILRLLERLERFLYRRSTHVVVVTEAFRDHLVARGVPASKISVVRNGVDGGLFSPRPPNAALLRSLGVDGEFLVSYIGTHGMAHGLGTLLEAAARLRAEPVRFVLIGSGAEKERLRRAAAEAGLDRVTFLDPHPHSEMPAFWSISDATVVPLRNHPLFRTTVPSKIFEAMAMGVPILLGVEGEARRIVEAAGAGIAFPPEDADGLAAAIRKLRIDGSLRREIRARAPEAARAFSRDELATRMLAVLREVSIPAGQAAR